MRQLALTIVPNTYCIILLCFVGRCGSIREERCVRAVCLQPLVASVVALPFAPHQVVSYNRALQVFLRRMRWHDWRRGCWMVHRRRSHHASVAGHYWRRHFFGRRHFQPDAAVESDLYRTTAHVARVKLWTHGKQYLNECHTRAFENYHTCLVPNVRCVSCYYSCIAVMISG